MNNKSNIREKGLAALTLIAIGVLTACNSQTHKNTVGNFKKSEKKRSTKILDSFINTPCAVIVYPTAEKIAHMKKTDGEDFYTIADDNQYYMGVSIGYLDSVKTKTITKESRGSITFETSTNQVFKIKLDTLSWGIILFNGKDRPLMTDITNVSDGYKSYMDK